MYGNDNDTMITIAESRDEYILRLALLKRNALAAPFERAAKTQKDLEGSNSTQLGEMMAVHYRDEEEIYVQAAPDRVTVFFSTVFREETDRVIGRVFLQVKWSFLIVIRGASLTVIFGQEFVDARRLSTLQNAPQVLYSNRDPPLELRNVAGLKTGENMGYVTFSASIASIVIPNPCLRPTL